jgi:hypothetical protein
MSSTSRVVASDALPRMPAAARPAQSREFPYAIIAVGVLIAMLAAAAFAVSRSEPLGGEEGADAVAVEPLTGD